MVYKMAQSSVQTWEDFFKRYYWENILELAKNYPEKRSLSIQFPDLERFDPEIASELLEHPDAVLKHANEAFCGIDLPVDVDFDKAHVRIVKLPEHIQIRELRSVNINKFIAVSGLIRKATEVRPKIVNAAFKCQRCDHITFVPQSEGKFVEPFECENDVCGRKGPFKLIHEESVFIDAQKLRVQESPDDLRGGEQPQTLDVDVDDDLAGTVSPGDRVVVSGILRSYQRSTQQGKSTFFDLVLDGISIEIEDKGFEDIEISKEEIKEILALGKDPQVYKKVIHSIAPSIYGYEEVKEAMALQLFSGIPKPLPDGTRIRGDVHILLVGDPGVAKSQLLRYGVRLAPRGIYTSGKSSTSAGLTATAVKDEFGEGRWTLEAGALVLADMGLACVDELDKMEADDRSSMHEAMEQQSYHPKTEIMFSNGEKKEIGRFVDELIGSNSERVIYGNNCEILNLSVNQKFKILTTDFKNIHSTYVDRVSRHKAPEYFVKITYSNGRSITVTPEHPVYILKDGEIKEIRADSVKKGMLAPAANPEIRFVEIKDVEILNNIDTEWVYDVTVEPNHTFISEGLVLHNTISIAKAGIMATLKSRCALLGAANPKFGRFDRYEPIAKQINMPPALLSRFDLIFILTDEPSVNRDTAIAEHILKAHYAGELSVRRENIINSGITMEEITKAMEVIQPVIQADMLRKYIAYTKKNIFPIIQDDARKQLIDFYLGLRKQGEDPNSPVPVTARQLEALIRLAEASARVRLSNVITTEDTDRIIRIVMASLKQVMTDPETGRLDADIINVGMGKSQRDKIKVMREIIREVQEEYKGTAPIEDIIIKAEESGIKKDTVEDIIQKLKSAGEIIEVSNERFRVV